MFRGSEEVFKKAAKHIDSTEEILNKDVKTVKNWLKTQPHLPEVMEDTPIKNFLLLNKGSVEKSKQKIDNYYTLRSLLPDFYENCNPQLPNMQKFMETAYCLTLPQLVDGLYRVFLCKNKEVDAFAPYEMTKLILNIAEIRLFEDCMVGEVYIIDMENISLSDLWKFTPAFVAKSFTIHEKIFSMRIKGLYFINSTSLITTLIGILKSILKPKIFERVHVCEDDKILKEIFLKENIPKDYGGKGPSLEELQNVVKTKFVEYKERFDKLDKMRVDESLRPEQLQNDELLGFYGNFKKLNVD